MRFMGCSVAAAPSPALWGTSGISEDQRGHPARGPGTNCWSGARGIQTNTLLCVPLGSSDSNIAPVTATRTRHGLAFPWDLRAPGCSRTAGWSWRTPSGMGGWHWTPVPGPARAEGFKHAGLCFPHATEMP